MSEAICPGHCNAQYRRARDAYKAALDEHARHVAEGNAPRPEPPDIKPWLGEPTWCGRCTSRIRQQLAELDDLGALRAATQDGMRAGTDERDRVSGSRTQQSPSPAADDVDEMVSMLAGWENAYRELRGWPSPPRRGYLATVLSSCTAWLGAHLDGILSCEFAEDFGVEVGRWHRAMTEKSGAGSGMHKKPIRCPRCELLTLTWREGDEYVSCGNPDCGRMLSLDEYQALAAAVAKSSAA